VTHRAWFRRSLRARLIRGEPEPAWLARHPRRGYVRAAILATPDWVMPSDFNALRALRAWEEEMWGVPFALDHVVPLNHPCICGLNVPWNIEVVPRTVNAAKGNRFHPDQRELFPAPQNPTTTMPILLAQPIAQELHHLRTQALLAFMTRPPDAVEAWSEVWNVPGLLVKARVSLRLSRGGRWVPHRVWFVRALEEGAPWRRRGYNWVLGAERRAARAAEATRA